MDPLATITTKATPQIQRATGPEGTRQVPNSAGGYTFSVDDSVRVRRFLTLGTTGGTYYAAERDLTKDNARVILNASQTRTGWLVDEIVAVSSEGRAPRNNPALFALAAAASLGDDGGRRAAFAALPKVARTGTHLFQFVGYCEQFRGWGRGLRRAVGGWYLDRPVEDVAYQVLKYRNRAGWTHRDVLRSAHPTGTGQHADLFEWIVRGTPSGLPLVEAFVEAQGTTSINRWVRLIQDHSMSWEMLPDAALTEPAVWEALIVKGMPQTALIRQLPRLTRLGVLTGDALQAVTGQLQDPARLRKGRVHPVNVLVAQRTYASGVSARGSSTWTPVRQVVDALDAAFYAAFNTIEPAGKRTLLALDVSGSMSSPAGGLPISCREVTAALSLVTMATEPDVTCVGFTAAAGRGMWARDTAIRELKLSPRQRLDDAVASIAGLPFGGTDCSAPYKWATQMGRTFDTVVIMTDNETWAGDTHPHESLAAYRRTTGVNTRQVVVGMTATDFSIADPLDPLSVDVAGFDSAVPNLISDFSRGDL
jgi:60 kDa SS-A/Ro ribonucleoprotein